MEFYSTTRKKQIILFAGKWMELGGPRVKRNKPDSERQTPCVESRFKKRSGEKRTSRREQGTGDGKDQSTLYEYMKIP